MLSKKISFCGFIAIFLEEGEEEEGELQKENIPLGSTARIYFVQSSI